MSPVWRLRVGGGRTVRGNLASLSPESLSLESLSPDSLNLDDCKSSRSNTLSVGPICSKPAGFVTEPRVVQSQVAQSLVAQP